MNMHSSRRNAIFKQGCRNVSIVSANGSDVPSEPPSPVDWKAALKRAIRSEAELRTALELPTAPQDGAGAPEFGVFVPLEYLAKIPPGEPAHPLLLQVLPQPRSEVDEPIGYRSDPVGDVAAEVIPGLLQKYRGRALWLVTSVCPVHCRYCFRQNFDYPNSVYNESRAAEVFDWLERDCETHEVILSGGDPFTLPDERLNSIVEQLAAIPHVRRLRMHTRMPIMIPQRTTDELVQLLSSTSLATWIVIHANHVDELDATVAEGLSRFVDAGIPLLNQAVLLRGVNDSVAALAALCERLVDLRVSPYYLHQLDPVSGASSFEVPIDEGLAIMRQLTESLPGYAVPRYVQEIAGQPSKTPL